MNLSGKDEAELRERGGVASRSAKIPVSFLLWKPRPGIIPQLVISLPPAPGQEAEGLSRSGVPTELKMKVIGL